MIDPISALGKSSDPAMALGVLARFIHWTKEQQITFVCTSLLSGSDPHQEATDLGVSTLCDSWIHLSYALRAGERNRALTVIKSRGTGHSNQVRELILSDAGVTLADVYQAAGEVFMGTLRWEHENADRDAERRLQTDAHKRRLELERNQAELRARSEALVRDLALIDLELAEGKRHERERLVRAEKRRAELLSQRWADVDGKAANGRARRRASGGEA